MSTVRATGLALAVVASLAVGTASASIDRLPEPAELPAQTAARVTHVPIALGTVTRKELSHAIAQQAATLKMPPPSPGQPAYERFAAPALNEVLDLIDIHGEATAMGIAVTPSQISAELEATKQDNFESQSAYLRFLRESRFTRLDVRLRVRAQIESTRIQERVARKIGRSGPALQQGFSEFVEAYLSRWRERTVCASEFATGRCSNGAPPNDPGPQANR